MRRKRSIKRGEFLGIKLALMLYGYRSQAYVVHTVLVVRFVLETTESAEGEQPLLKGSLSRAIRSSWPELLMDGKAGTLYITNISLSYRICCNGEGGLGGFKGGKSGSGGRNGG